MGEKKRKNGAPTCRAWERNFHVFYDLFMKKKKSAGERDSHVFYDLSMKKKTECWKQELAAAAAATPASRRRRRQRQR